MSKILGLGEYDSPAPQEESPEGEGAAGSNSAIQLSIVDYENDPDEKGEDEQEEDSVLGISLDDDAVHRAAPRRVGVGGVQISVVKKPAAKPPKAQPDAPDTQAEESALIGLEVEREQAAAFVIPGSPAGEVDARLADKFKALVAKTSEGYSVNEHIRNAKSFRNPDILEKLVAFFDVRECGTNYPPRLYDPNELTKEEHYDRLEEARRKWEERQERKPGEKVAFSSGGTLDQNAKPHASCTAAGSASNSAAPSNPPQGKPRKSKWDSSGSNAPPSDPPAKRQSVEG